MATTPGQRFVRRHNAARTSTSNTSAGDISYDTSVLSEGGYSWSAPEVTVDEAGLYLCIFDIGEVQLSGSTRAVGTLLPSVNTTDQTYYKGRHRYLRNSGGNHNVSNGMCILDLSVNDDVKIRNPGVVTGTDSLGNYATNSGQGGGLQMIRLNAGNFTEVRRTTSQSPVTITYANATRPWLNSTLLTTQVTWTTEVRDDDNLYGGSGGDLTLAANTKYMILYGGTMDGSSGQRHAHILQLEINGNDVQHSYGYERNNASDGPPMQGIYLHETGGTTETLRLNAGVEQEDNAVSNTVGIDNAWLQVLELPSDAEWIHVDNGATDSLTTALAGTSTYYDTPLSSTVRADGDSNLSLDAANDAVQNDSGASMPILAIGWHKWDRDGVTSGTRKHCWTYWDNGGTRIAYGTSGGYNRGSQGNDDTYQLAYVSAATMDLANAADLSFQVRDPQNASNSDMGIYAAGSRYFLGVQVLNLDTLAASGQTVEAGLATETDSALAVSAAKNLEAGLASSAESALAATAAKATEVGLTSEADSALAATSGKALEVGLSTEAETSLGVGALKELEVGLANETDTSLPATALGEQVVEVGLATEADSSFAVTSLKELEAGLTTETDSSLAAGSLKELAVGLTTETDTALDTTPDKAVEAGLAEETSSAFSVSRLKTVIVGIAVEIDSALGAVGFAEAQLAKKIGMLLKVGKGMR